MRNNIVNVTIRSFSRSIIGEISLPCSWVAIMGDAEESLKEQRRIGHELEKLGVGPGVGRISFCQYDWPKGSAIYYVK